MGQTFPTDVPSSARRRPLRARQSHWARSCPAEWLRRLCLDIAKRPQNSICTQACRAKVKASCKSALSVSAAAHVLCVPSAYIAVSQSEVPLHQPIHVLRSLSAGISVLRSTIPVHPDATTNGATAAPSAELLIFSGSRNRTTLQRSKAHAPARSDLQPHSGPFRFVAPVGSKKAWQWHGIRMTTPSLRSQRDLDEDRHRVSRARRTRSAGARAEKPLVPLPGFAGVVRLVSVRHLPLRRLAP